MGEILSLEERRRHDAWMDKTSRLAALIHELLVFEAKKVPTQPGRHQIVAMKVGDYVIGSVSSRIEGVEGNDVTLLVRSIGVSEEQLFMFSFREFYTSRPGQGTGVDHSSVTVPIFVEGAWIDRLTAILEAEAAEIAASAKRN